MARIEGIFGAHDSELKGGEYTIPDGMDAEIKDGKIIVKERESEDERIIQFFAELATDACGGPGQEYYEELGLNYDKVMAWLEKHKELKKRLHVVLSVLSNGRIKKAIEIYPDECDCKVGDVVKAIIKK